jgi:short-subunit dehydrogenase
VLPGAVDTDFFRRRGVPYDRRYPRPVSAERVADAVVHGVLKNRTEVVVPRWLTLGSRVHGAAPALFARLSRAFG